MKKKSILTSSDWLIALAMAYAAVTLAMNVFCMKSLSWGTGVTFSDGGQTISWIVFLISNVIVEVWGEKESIKVITFAAVITFVLLVIGRLIVFIPSLAEYEEQNRAFSDAVLRIRDESLKEKNKTLDPADMKGLQELVKAKKDLEDLRRKRQQLHISFE